MKKRKSDATNRLMNPIIVPNLNQSFRDMSYPYLFETDVVITPAEDPIGVILPPSPTPSASDHQKISE